MFQKQRQVQISRAKQVEQDDAPADVQDSSLNDDIDAILDEIDEVLEVNAKDFVKNYVQKGGE